MKMENRTLKTPSAWTMFVFGVLADFSDTTIGKDLIDLLTASSQQTKSHVMKTAVLGVTGAKRILANVLMSTTGQKLIVFETRAEALDWLAQ